MKTADIRKQIEKATGISQLNTMQTTVAASTARNFVLLAPTGSGKTLAFTIAMLRNLDAGKAGQGVKAVVAAPSRELAMQIHSVVRPVAAGFKTVAFYGGSSFAAEEQSAKGSVPDIVIATPGRLLDHLNRRTLDLGAATVLVLDEYDKILELGFHEEMKRIVKRMPAVKHTVLTSATELREVPDFISLADTEILDFSETAASAGRVRIMSVPSPAKDKLDTLAALLREIADGQTAMVFVNHRESAERVVDGLRRRRIDAVLYHGGIDQREREMAVATFRSEGAPVLVATDLAARGLDIDDVGSVVHYHAPTSEQAWTHRNGRTARAGASGSVYVITGPEESLPDYVVTERDHYADMSEEAEKKAIKAKKTMIYVNAGKRDKVSKGDIAGFAMKQCGVAPSALGVITVGLDYSLIAVDREYAKALLDFPQPKIKGHRVRLSAL